MAAMLLPAETVAAVKLTQVARPSTSSASAPKRLQGSGLGSSHGLTESWQVNRQTGAVTRRGVPRASQFEGYEETVGFGRRLIPTDGGDGIKLECDESGCIVVLPPQVQDESDVPGILRCDMTGCTVSEAPAPEPRFEEVEGQGWRIGYETRPESEESFCAMIGAGGWSVGLTAVEFSNFVDMVQMLRSSLATMDEDGMVGGDEVQLEVEKGSIWMQCSLPKKRVSLLRKFWNAENGSELSAFEVRFILGGASNLRQAEGYWPAEAVMDFLKKLDEYRDNAGKNGAAASAPAMVEEVTAVAV